MATELEPAATGIEAAVACGPQTEPVPTGTRRGLEFIGESGMCFEREVLLSGYGAERSVSSSRPLQTRFKSQNTSQLPHMESQMRTAPVEVSAPCKRKGFLGVVNATLTLAALLAVAACGGSGNGNGSSPPTLSYAGSTGTTGAAGAPMSVSPTTLVDNGAAITACGIKPGSANASSFPSTLNVNATSCVISGTPTTSLPATVFTLVAANSAGTSADATVTLAVGAGIPTLSYVGTAGTVNNIGTPMNASPTTASGNGGAITACGIKPGSANASSFPATLSVNAATCVISGTPTAPLPATQFTVVATNSAGPSADATVILEVHAGWFRQLGPDVLAGAAIAYGVAVDVSGNSYAAGYTDSAFSGNTQSGQYDYFIAKHDPSGTLVWIKQLGADGQETEAKAVAVDASGNSYVSGYTDVALNGNTRIGYDDAFIAKYDPSGALLWLAELGAPLSETSSLGVAVDASGSSYMTGFTSGGLNGNTQSGSDDLFIAKYDSSGTLTWVKQLGVASSITGTTSIALDGSGNIYVAGQTGGGLNGNTQSGQYDYFVAKYNSSGSLTWVRQQGASMAQSYAYGVGVDGSGNAYVGGYTNGGLNGNTQAGTQDYFIAKYDASGTLSWLNQEGVAANMSQVFGVAADKSGNSYVAGSTSGGLNGNTQTGAVDFFIAKYDTSGTVTWLKQQGVAGDNDLNAYAIAVDPSGNSYVAGETNVGVDGNTQVGLVDYSIANYNSSGTF